MSDNINITLPIKNMEQRFRASLLGLPLIMGNTALNFALENFKKQGFQDTGFQKWRQRKDPTAWGEVKRPGRALLFDTGKLRRSGHIAFLNSDQVKLEWPLPYAKAHNEGISGLGVIQSIKPFTRSDGKSVSAHTRKINIKLPKRQFIGESIHLRNLTIRAMALHINKSLK